MKSTLFLFCFLVLVGCAKTPKQEVLQAIDLAQSYLSEEKCQEAIDVLEEVGRQNDNAIYLQVLASAYACRADFNAIHFIGTDIPLIQTSSANLLKSLSVLTLSTETSADSSAYEDMKTALEILLYSDGGAQPSQATRTTKYGPRKAGDMGVEILLLSIVQLGKFLHYYGNVDSLGVKGEGPEVSNCFINYTYGTAQAARASFGGSCNADNLGHPELIVTGGNLARGIRRRCEGLMLLTNLIDTLDNLDLSANSSLDDLEAVATTANTFKSTAITADATLATLLNITSQSVCESTLASPTEMDNMELIYALLFESGLQ